MNNYSKFYAQALLDHHEAIESLSKVEAMVSGAAEKMVCSSKSGGTIYWCGNGGSAADCQHYAAELMVRYVKDRDPIRSVALTTDTSLLTAHCNDIGFESVFERQVKSLIRPGDVLVGISTSGNSQNVLRAVTQARQQGALTVGMLGRDGGKIKDIVDYPIVVESNITASIQEAHLVLGHYLCKCLEEFNGQHL
tara:strand:- start:2556 stop:3137 length:582 start_codon:yes stop_codon:yes gene_type:complete